MLNVAMEKRKLEIKKHQWAVEMQHQGKKKPKGSKVFYKIDTTDLAKALSKNPSLVQCPEKNEWCLNFLF